MHPQTIFTKTSKGVLEVKNKTIRLSSELGSVFVAVDGKSPFSALQGKTELDENTLQESVEKLLADGYIKIFFQPIVERKSVELEPIPVGTLIEDLDFTSPAKVAELTSEAELRAKAEAAAKARAEAAARGAAEAKARQETEARARAAAEAKVKQELAAKLKAEEAARAATQASAKAQSDVNSATEEKAKAEAQARVRAAIEAKTKAEAEARARGAAETKAKTEVEANTKAEAVARAEGDTRSRAETEARAAAQAEARARVAVETKMRAMEQALKEAEAHAKAEAAARAQAQAESKARAEIDAKARAEAEARAKAAEDAIAQARAVADAATAATAVAEAKVQSGLAAEAATDTAVEKAKLAEIARAIEASRLEALAKAEQAQLALAEAEARAKAEAEARVASEAKAKAEAEQRAQEDLQRKAEIQIAREEAEARTREQMKALEENIRKAREEALAREESEKKSRAEAEARIEVERKARREAEAQIAAERASRDVMVDKAREEAARTAQAAAAATVEAQRLAHEQSTARAQAEASVRLAQAEQKAAAEKLARAAAEDRAKQESIARVMQEHSSKQRSEKEISGKVEAELKARQQAELQAEISARVNAQKRAEESAAKRALEREQGPEEVTAAPAKKPVNLGIMAAIGLFAILGIGLVVVQFMPLSGYIGGVEKLLSERLQEPVSIFNMRFSLLPSPQFKIERIVIGKAQDVKIETAIIPVSSLAILDEQKNLDEVQLSSITIDQSAIPRLAIWAQPQAGDSKLHIDRLTLTNIKLAGTGVDMPAFQGTIMLEKNGSVQKVLLRDPKLSVELTPAADGLHVSFSARSWQPPFGIAAEIPSLSGTAVVTKQQITVTGLDGRLQGGALKGNVTIKLGGGLTADGDFSLKGADVGPLLAMYTRQFVASGALDLTAKFSTQGKTLDALFDAPRVTATLTVKNGALNNIDLVRAIQSPSSKAQHGGKTTFSEIAGEAQVSANRISYRNLNLVSGPMNGTGNVDVSPTGDLSGRLNVVLGSQTVTVARGTLNVSGSLKDPLLSNQ